MNLFTMTALEAAIHSAVVEAKDWMAGVASDSVVRRPAVTVMGLVCDD